MLSLSRRITDHIEYYPTLPVFSADRIRPVIQDNDINPILENVSAGNQKSCGIGVSRKSPRRGINTTHVQIPRLRALARRLGIDHGL